MLTDNACASFKASGISPTTIFQRGSKTALGRLRRSQLVACLALVLPISAIGGEAANAVAYYNPAALRHVTPPRQIAATRTVGNCSDSGPGSLREAASLAQSDDLIDMSGLQCSLITLQSGDIPLTVQNITVSGPGASALAIDGNDQFRIFTHSGSGVLTINDLKLQTGYAESDSAAEVKGGCVYSSGSIVFNNSLADICYASINSKVSTRSVSGGALSARGYVYLHNSSITRSKVGSTSGLASGGAIYAGRDVYLVGSTVSGNYASSYYAGITVRGGAIFTVGNVVMNRSTVAHNGADSGSGFFAGPSYGGGIYAQGFARGARGTQILNSTISGNVARNVGGAEILNGNGINYSANIVNSTISENYASNRTGGLATSTPLTLSNSTLFNNAAGGSAASAAGFQTYSTQVVLQSSILAYNYALDRYFDFDAGTATPGGGNNLIIATSTPTPGTLTANPQLRPLANNGGPTLTHAPKTNSPAIGHGNNLAGQPYDQRGPGFPRVLGGAPDIGAVESDGIFADGFELLPTRPEGSVLRRPGTVGGLAYTDTFRQKRTSVGMRILRAAAQTACPSAAALPGDSPCR